jgi:hypothetical protein
MAVLIGMANPIVLSWPEEVFAVVIMPITWPALSASAPPSSPGPTRALGDRSLDSATGTDGTAQGVDHARGGRHAALPLRVTEGEDWHADGYPAGVAEGGDRQVRDSLKLKQGDVLGGVVAQDSRGIGPAGVDERGLHAGRADDVIIAGEDETIGGQHDARVDGHFVAVRQVGPEVDQAWRDFPLHLGLVQVGARGDRVMVLGEGDGDHPEASSDNGDQQVDEQPRTTPRTA